MADSERQQLDLARAQRHLEAAEMGALLTQRAIAKLEAQGKPTVDELRKLKRLQAVIDTMSGYRRAVLAASPGLEAAARALPPEAPCLSPIPAPSRWPAAAGRAS